MPRSQWWAAAMLAACLPVAGPAAGQVMPDVMGTAESAQRWLDRAKTYVRDRGISALLKNLSDPKAKFGGSIHHIAVERVKEDQIFVVRHNRYETLRNVDFTNQQDLNGKYFIREFAEDARTGGGKTELTLQIPETGNVKTSWCLNEWAPGFEGTYIITVCY